MTFCRVDTGTAAHQNPTYLQNIYPNGPIYLPHTHNNNEHTTFIDISGVFINHFETLGLPTLHSPSPAALKAMTYQLNPTRVSLKAPQVSGHQKASH